MKIYLRLGRRGIELAPTVQHVTNLNGCDSEIMLVIVDESADEAIHITMHREEAISLGESLCNAFHHASIAQPYEMKVRL
jgi:hypothetical protein